jgi:purine nucleoside phosphorylase
VGCTHVLASAACGSLREEIKPGDLVLLGSFIDRCVQLHTGWYVYSVIPDDMRLHSGHVAYSILFRKETKQKLIKTLRRTNCMEQSHSSEANSHSAG